MPFEYRLYRDIYWDVKQILRVPYVKNLTFLDNTKPPINRGFCGEKALFLWVADTSIPSQFFLNPEQRYQSRKDEYRTDYDFAPGSGIQRNKC